MHPQKVSYTQTQATSIDWGGRNTSMVYDAAGRMTLRTDPLNHTISNSYDSLARSKRASGSLEGKKLGRPAMSSAPCASSSERWRR
jgi:YD repeat-containing protein